MKNVKSNKRHNLQRLKSYIKEHKGSTILAIKSNHSPSKIAKNNKHTNDLYGDDPLYNYGQEVLYQNTSLPTINHEINHKSSQIILSGINRKPTKELAHSITSTTAIVTNNKRNSLKSGF